jgi:hypothetical protein
MSDDATTREAVEIVKRTLGNVPKDDETPFAKAVRTLLAALEDALEDCDDLGAVLTLAQQEAATVESNHRAEVDAATTAERDRIRKAVDARKMAHDPECPVCQKGPNCAGLLITHSVNAALADVARIIDAEGA